MTDAPKTDAAVVRIHRVVGYWKPDTQIVRADFAREQERTIADLQRDVARYRWLRSRPQMDIAACWLLPLAQPHIDEGDMDAFDAAVDAAIQQSPLPLSAADLITGRGDGG